MGRIVVKCYMEECLTNEQGEKMRDLVLKENSPITLDFSEITGMSTSFINSSFVDLLESKGIDFIRSLRIVNSTKQMNTTIQQRVKFEKDKKLVTN